MKSYFLIALAASGLVLTGSAFGGGTVSGYGNIDEEDNWCSAESTGPTGGNVVIYVGDPVVKTVVTPNGKVNATCHGPDISGVYEDMAEQGRILADTCAITLLDGTPVVGSGHVVAAANDNCDGSCGGNVTIVCHGQLEED